MGFLISLIAIAGIVVLIDCIITVWRDAKNNALWFKGIWGYIMAILYSIGWILAVYKIIEGVMS